MRPTIDILYQKFHYFNDLCFGGKLPTVEIKLSRARKSLGQLRFRVSRSLLGRRKITNLYIGISTSFDMSEAMMEDTLIHEMIHLHILVNRLRDESAHGPVFQSIMNDINERYHRHISISHRANDGEAVAIDRPRRNYVCVSTFTDGRRGITIATESVVFQMWHDMARVPSISRCDWYFSTHPLLSRYRRSRTLKVYVISEADLAKILETAVPLVNEDGVIRSAD